MTVLIEARVGSPSKLLQKKHMGYSQRRAIVCWEMFERLRKVCRLIVVGLKRVYAVPFIVQRTFKSPAPSEQEGEHRGRPSSKWRSGLKSWKREK